MIVCNSARNHTGKVPMTGWHAPDPTGLPDYIGEGANRPGDDCYAPTVTE